MSRPSTHVMLKELSEHLKVPRDGHNIPDWTKAIKKAAGKEFAAIEVVYDDWKKSQEASATTADKPVERDTPRVEDTAKSTGGRKGEVMAPTPATMSAATINEGAVAVHVTAPEAAQTQVVYMPPRDALGIATTLASRGQTLLLGLVIGILISKPVLKALGYS